MSIRTSFSLCSLMLAGSLLATSAHSSEIFVVKESNATSTVSLGGTVIPFKEVTLAAQVPGRVKSIIGVEGTYAEEATVLVEIDDTELVAQRQAAAAKLGDANAALRNAGAQYQRELWAPQSRELNNGMGMPTLFDSMFTKPMGNMMGQSNSSNNWIQRQADLARTGTHMEQARNSIMAAQSQIQALDSKIRDARSVAPFSGVIVKKFVEVGDTVQPGQPLVKYADLQYLQVVIDVPANLVDGLREGDRLGATLDDNRSGELEVRVAQVFPMATQHTVKVKFDLPIGLGRPGMFATVRVPDGRAGGAGMLYIPLSALVDRGSLKGVCVLNDDNQPELHLVRLGEGLPDGEHVSVLSGLQVDARILRNPGRTCRANAS